MGVINVKFPDGLEEEINDFIEDDSRYINRSEAIRAWARDGLESEKRGGSDGS